MKGFFLTKINVSRDVISSMEIQSNLLKIFISLGVAQFVA